MKKYSGKNIDTWTEYWISPDKYRDIISREYMKYFLRKVENIMAFNNNDFVLDIGSGTCELAAGIKDKVKEVHCVDVSETYLSTGRQKLADFKNIKYFQLEKNNYTDLSVLEDNKYNKIICLSVVQYYKNIQEVEALINQLGKVAVSGAKILIADIPIKKPSSGDALQLLSVAFRNQFFKPALINMLSVRFSPYYKLYKHKGLLVFNSEKIGYLTKNTNGNLKIINEKLTLNSNRIHILINV